MGRTKGSGNQYIENMVVRNTPATIERVKKLAEVRGTSFSDEVREAIDKHLVEFDDLLDGV